jgi:hypothetical protein
MFNSLKTNFDQWRERRRQRLRVRFYGLGPSVAHFAILVSWVVIGLVFTTLESEGVAGPFWLFWAILLAPVPFWFWFDGWLEKRQRRRDVARALASMERPLRRREEADGNYVDFDPEFIALQPNGKYVWALDRRRRLMRFIMANTKNGDYVWPFDVQVVKGELVDAPARRRLFGLRPARRGTPSPHLTLAVTVIGRDGSKGLHELPFRHEDRKIAEKWRDTFLEWTRDSAAVKTSGR